MFETISLKKKSPLKGKKALVTAGPTFEPIDPVRFIGNHSSGIMGYAIANELHSRGAEVVLVSGPVNNPITLNSEIIKHSVTTAIEMMDVCRKEFSSVDIAVMAAAVADYRPVDYSKQKIKKNENALIIELVKNPDILATLGNQKRQNQLLIGFALETHDEIENAKIKLHNKNLDCIVLNSLNQEGAGFKTLTNQVSILYPNGTMHEYSLKSKQEVAYDICQAIENLIEKNKL